MRMRRVDGPGNQIFYSDRTARRSSLVEQRELPVLRHAAVHTPSAPHSRHFALHHSTLRPDFTPFHTQTLTAHSRTRSVMCVFPPLT